MATVTKRRRKIGVDPQGKPIYQDEGWQVRYVDPDGAQKKRKFVRQKDAQRFASEVEVQKATGSYIDAAAAKVTFKEYAEAWRVVQPWRPNTAAIRVSRLRKYVYPEIGSKPIGAIRRSDVQAMIRKAERTMDGRKRGDEDRALSFATVESIASTVQAVFLGAVEDRIIAVSPATRLKLTRQQVDEDDDEGEVVALTPEQYRVFEAALPERLRIAAVLGLSTGMRIGEVAGLTVDRVDFLRRRIRVNRQLLPSGEFGPPKTEASKRWIPVPESLLHQITEHIRKYPDPVEGRGLLLTGERGGLGREPLIRAVLVAARKAGMSDRQRFHSLRHTFASNLISANKSIKVVQKLLGHSKIQETLDTYAHMLPSDEESAVDAIDAALRAFSVAPSSPQGSCGAR